MELHLLCIPGERDIRNILEASRPYLAVQAQPVVAYLPAASYRKNWLEYTEKAFQGLAKVELIDAETMQPGEVEAILDRAGVIYISGGNTFLLSYRLHERGLVDGIRRHILEGLPVAAFSAGTILCGPNVLTSGDMNMCGTFHFGGLGLVPYNFCVHYPAGELERSEQDGWLSEYFAYHTNPILIMDDGAYLKASQAEITVVRGNCWLLEKDAPQKEVEIGQKLSLK